MFMETALSYPQVRLWHKCFKDGRTSPKDNARTGRPSSRLDSVDDIENSMREDRRKTIQEIALDVGRTPSTVHKVLKKDLDLCKLSAKFMPHFLNDANKRMRMQLSSDNLENVRTVPWYLDQIVTGDETWVSLYNQETKFVLPVD